MGMGTIPNAKCHLRVTMIILILLMQAHRQNKKMYEISVGHQNICRNTLRSLAYNNLSSNQSMLTAEDSTGKKVVQLHLCYYNNNPLFIPNQAQTFQAVPDLIVESRCSKI